MPKTLERNLRHPKRVSAPTRIPLTRRQCETLIESGELKGRFELIDGEIISKMGQKRPHSLSMVLLVRWLTAEFGPLYVQIQSPVNVAKADNPTNEPEPDGVVLHDVATAYPDGNPNPQDIALLVELADSSLRFDLQTKAALYSRAGIADYWVVDILGRKLYVHREPTLEGYRDVMVYAEDEMAAPLAKPDVMVRVGELLPPMVA